MCWESKRFYWEGRPGGEQEGWGNPGGPLCHVARSLRVYGDGISFRVVFSQWFWLRVLPGSGRIAQPRWMPERRILGGGQTCGVSFWPFPNSSGWWRLIVPCSSPGPPVVKQLMRTVAVVPGRGGRSQSACFPNTALLTLASFLPQKYTEIRIGK